MLYFNTMDTAEDRDLGPNYSEWVARWEWPPWLKLTAFGQEHLVAGDLLLRRFPSTIPERDCRAFDTNPFGRCAGHSTMKPMGDSAARSTKNLPLTKPVR